MRVPVSLFNAFKDEFETKLVDFLLENELIPEREALQSRRFLTRSVAPHVQTLSQLFNRITIDEEGKKISSQKDDGHTAIDQEGYWAESGNPKNRRLAYFLSFMPCNLYRVASVWGELHRLGFRWPFPVEQDFRALEWGAGTASGACGILAGEKHAPIGLPENGSFALIEQNKASLALGTKWFEFFTGKSARPFHRRVDLAKPWLPPNAPRFHLFVMSYFLNETDLNPEILTKNFIDVCERHLEEEGLVIIVEPAAKVQSRKLLEFRKAFLANPRIHSPLSTLKILLPCLGAQACGALSKDGDWCHDEVSWFRPNYLRDLDALVNLDRKTLPFSYLVIQKTKKPLEEILPALKGTAEQRYRLVSPSFRLSKKTSEFFVCGQDGKRRARFVAEKAETPHRGDILQNVSLHGDPALSQIERAEMLDADFLGEAPEGQESGN